ASAVLRAAQPLSGRHIVGVEFTKDRVGEHYELLGPAKLHIDDEVVAEQELRVIPAFYALCGEGLCIGYDSGDAVSSAYTPKFEWSGGQIHKVVFDRGGAVYGDVEAHMGAGADQGRVPRAGRGLPGAGAQGGVGGQGDPVVPLALLPAAGGRVQDAQV